MAEIVKTGVGLDAIANATGKGIDAAHAANAANAACYEDVQGAWATGSKGNSSAGKEVAVKVTGTTPGLENPGPGNDDPNTRSLKIPRLFVMKATE